DRLRRTVALLRSDDEARTRGEVGHSAAQQRTDPGRNRKLRNQRSWYFCDRRHQLVSRQAQANSFRLSRSRFDGAEGASLHLSGQEARVSVHHIFDKPAEEAWCRAGAPEHHRTCCRAGTRGALIRAPSRVRPKQLARLPEWAPRRSAAATAGPGSLAAGEDRALRAPPAGPRRPGPRSLSRWG